MKKSDQSFIMVLGTLSKQRNILQAPDIDGLPQDRLSTIRFTGMQGTRGGFDRAIDVDIELREKCLVSWCGAASFEPVKILTFLETTPYGYSLQVGPCNFNAFYNPSKKVIKNALRCLRGGVCAPKENF